MRLGQGRAQLVRREGGGAKIDLVEARIGWNLREACWKRLPLRVARAGALQLGVIAVQLLISRGGSGYMRSVSAMQSLINERFFMSS